LNACPYRATSVPHVCPQIIEFYRGDNNSDAGGHYHFSKIFVPWGTTKFQEDFGLWEGYYNRPHDKRYYDYMAQVANRVLDVKADFGAKKKLMVLREDANNRLVTNIDDVKRLLRRYGYESYNPAGDAVQEQMAMFSAATHIVAVHGAALSNLIWSAPSVRLLELLPVDYQDFGYRAICGNKSIKHRILPVESFKSTENLLKPPQKRDVVVDLGHLEFAISNME
jgi:hypothetical protein